MFEKLQPGMQDNLKFSAAGENREIALASSIQFDVVAHSQSVSIVFSWTIWSTLHIYVGFGKDEAAVLWRSVGKSHKCDNSSVQHANNC